MQSATSSGQGQDVWVVREFFAIPLIACSCKIKILVTPLFKVQLEDVLARKHLPPLSLKDFEEWLLFIEQCPENLYFVLWLREYERRWVAWERRQQRHDNADADKETRVTFSPSSALSPSLAFSFERARATSAPPARPTSFACPPSSSPPSSPTTLPPLLGRTPPTPDPAAFAALSTHLHTRLRASLNRCVRAAYNNVGTFRATCGIVGGLVISLIGAGIPLLVELVAHGARGSRWARLAALPGLWLGLTVIVASLRGVCMMVYVFGDFRQLRRFELERPPAPVPTQQQLDEKAEGHSRSRSASRGADVDERRKSSVSVVSTVSSMSSVYSTSSNPTNPMAAHTYPKKPPAIHLHTPVRALTAPPRIAVRIPEGRSFSVVSGTNPRSSFSVRESEHDEEDGDGVSVLSDDASEESDHGIYVSPQYAPPDELAALDAQGVQAALAMARRMAGEAQQAQTAEGETGESGESPVVGNAEWNLVGEAPPAVEKQEVSPPPQQTARFIPAYPFKRVRGGARYVGVRLADVVFRRERGVGLDVVCMLDQCEEEGDGVVLFIVRGREEGEPGGCGRSRPGWEGPLLEHSYQEPQWAAVEDNVRWLPLHRQRTDEQQRGGRRP